MCVCDQGYQTGYAYLSQADRAGAGSDAELVPSTGVGISLTGSDRDELLRLGSAVSADFY